MKRAFAWVMFVTAWLLGVKLLVFTTAFLEHEIVYVTMENLAR